MPGKSQICDAIGVWCDVEKKSVDLDEGLNIEMINFFYRRNLWMNLILLICEFEIINFRMLN